MAQYGDCNCLCAECVPGTARPYKDIYKHPWYTYPQLHAGDFPAYTLSECVDEAIPDAKLSYIHIIYIDNAGTATAMKQAVVKLYHTLTYAPSSLISLEQVNVYVCNLEGASAGTTTALYIYLYEYGSIYHYVRGVGVRIRGLNFNSRLFLPTGFLQLGGFRITDFSRLHLHIRSSFNTASKTIETETTFSEADTTTSRRRFPDTTISYTGNWKAANALLTFGPIYKALGINGAEVYISPSTAVGSTLWLRFAHMHPTTSRSAKHAWLLLRRSTQNIGSSGAVFHSSLYNNTTHLNSRDITVYTLQSGDVDHLLTAAQHAAIHDWSNLRWRLEVISNSLTGAERAGFNIAMFHKLITFRWAISNLYLRRTCL